MSTEAAAPVVATPAAPAPTAAPAAAAPAPEKPAAAAPEDPKARRSTRDQARARAIERAGQLGERAEQARAVKPTEQPAPADPAAAAAADGQPRNPDGTFAPKAPTEGAPPAATAPTKPETTTPKPAAGAAAPPEGFERIEVPAGHPWRAGERFPHLDVPREMGEAIRMAMKEPVRKAHVAELQTQNQQLWRQLASERAHRELLQDGKITAGSTDPRVQKLLEDLKGSEHAGLYEQVKAALESAPDSLVAERAQAIEAEAATVEAAQSIAHAAREYGPRLYPVWAQSGELVPKLQQFAKEYGRLVDAGVRQPSRKDFFAWVDRTHYIADPRVQALVRARSAAAQEEERKRIREEEAAKARADLATQEAARLEEAKGRHGKRPPSLPLGHSRGEVETPGRETAQAPTSRSQRQRAARQAAGQLAEQALSRS